MIISGGLGVLYSRIARTTASAAALLAGRAVMKLISVLFATGVFLILSVAFDIQARLTGLIFGN